MHNLASRAPHKTCQKRKKNTYTQRKEKLCRTVPTVNTFGIHLRGHTKSSSNPNGSLVFWCYLFFGLMVGRFPFVFFCSAVLYFFYPSQGRRVEQGTGAAHRWRWQGFPGDFEFWFQFGYMTRRWQRAASCEPWAAASELRTQFVSLDKCPVSKEGKKERNVSSPDVCY